LKTALFRHRLRAFNDGVTRRVRPNPRTQRYGVDTFLCADAGDRNVDRVEQLRRFALADSDNGAAAVNPRIDTEDFHLRNFSASSPTQIQPGHCWRANNSTKGPSHSASMR
jgi:hypothetical protein